MSARHLLFGSLGLLLIAGIVLIAYGSTRPLMRTFHGQLVELLPAAPVGWTRTLRPIADSPEMQKAVGEILNYDDGVFADYTRGPARLTVYIAYWTPGKMQHRQVASHTPDVCWVGAGWQCTARGQVRYALTTDGGEQRSYVGRQMSAVRPQPSALSPQPSVLPPAETRTFTVKNTTEYVWFWHLVGGVPKSYGTGSLPPWYASFADILEKGLQQREEQFFIRLSSPQPLDDPAVQPALDAVLRALPLLDASS
jgi:hypothetical protein